jgi:hypothetical protein
MWKDVKGPGFASWHSFDVETRVHIERIKNS